MPDSLLAQFRQRSAYAAMIDAAIRRATLAKSGSLWGAWLRFESRYRGPYLTDRGLPSSVVLAVDPSWSSPETNQERA